MKKLLFAFIFLASFQQAYSQVDSVQEMEEKQAEFPGGMKAFIKYIQDSLVYPQYAIDNCIQGKVWLIATISKNGEVSDISVLQSSNPIFDSVAVSVLKHSPRWNPGEVDYKPVNSKIRIPINFVMEHCDKHRKRKRKGE
jgi:protein TonB